MRPVVMRRLTVRAVAAALDGMAELELVEHNVSREECRRYLSLSSEQWWQIVGFLKEQDAQTAHSH